MPVSGEARSVPTKRHQNADQPWPGPAPSIGSPFVQNPPVSTGDPARRISAFQARCTSSSSFQPFSLRPMPNAVCVPSISPRKTLRQRTQPISVNSRSAWQRHRTGRSARTSGLARDCPTVAFTGAARTVALTTSPPCCGRAGDG